jgi:hypothetical protein
MPSVCETGFAIAIDSTRKWDGRVVQRSTEQGVLVQYTAALVVRFSDLCWRLLRVDDQDLIFLSHCGGCSGGCYNTRERCFC